MQFFDSAFSQKTVVNVDQRVLKSTLAHLSWLERCTLHKRRVRKEISALFSSFEEKHLHKKCN
jgi:hypothetical protein